MDTFDDYLARAAVVHFRAHELASREERGGPKTVVPPAGLWSRILPALHVADLIRQTLNMPVRVVSGYRTPDHNRLVGGSPTSEHVEFRALDLTCDDLISMRYLADILLDSLSRRGVPTGLGLYDSFVHIDIGSTKAGRRRWDSR